VNSEQPIGTSSARDLALSASGQAAAALAELTRFAKEGPNWPTPFGDVEVIELLADALKLTLEAEALEIGDDRGHPEEAEMRNQLLGACVRFLDGWAG
jgi:hypothetical protein